MPDTLPRPTILRFNGFDGSQEEMLLATLEPDQLHSTLDLNVSFLRPVRPGRIVGKGKVVRRDGDIAYLEASLTDAGGAAIATATAIARVIPLTQAKTAV